MENSVRTYLVILMMVILAFTGLMLKTPFEAVDVARGATGGPVDQGWDDADGRDRYICNVADWTTEDGDAIRVENMVIEMDDTSILIDGGSLVMVNCTVLWDCSAENLYGITLTNGNLTVYNSTFKHKGLGNDSVDEFMWFILMDDEGVGKDSVNFTAYNSTFNASISTLFAAPDTNPNMAILGGNLTAYHCIFEMPEQYYGTDENVSFVNCRVVGNHSFETATATLNWVNAHYITFHDNYTASALFDADLQDAEGDVMTCVNRSMPSGIGLSSAFMFPPDLNTHWFAKLNRTETSAGVTNSSHTYPLTFSVDKPTAWTDNTKYTLKRISPKEHCLDKFEDDFNISVGNWNITEAAEDAYTSKVLRTTLLSFSTAQVSFALESPSDIDYTVDWVDWTTNESAYVDYEARGSYVLDYVVLSANAGNDLSVIKGANKTFDGTGATGENPILNYTWVFKNSTGSTVLTEYGSAPWEIVNFTAGVYTITQTITDDEGARDSDTATMTITAPSTSGSGTTGSATADDDWDWWPYGWMRFWRTQYWDEIWDVIKDLFSGTSLIIILFLLIVTGLGNYIWDTIYRKNAIPREGKKAVRGWGRFWGRK